MTLTRLLQPQSIAVIGGGTWCVSVIEQAERMGFAGDIWPVHPKAEEVAGHRAYARIEDLPRAPDAAFVGINRFATVESVEALSTMGAGGAVAFASGFSEALAEDESADDLQVQLVAAAGDMPVLGPNCYGFINALDAALLWPDQHGCTKVERGVALLTQSSNIAINLTMQQRALPISYVITCGNMAQTSQAKIAMALLDDPRVTAIGCHVEGFGVLSDWEALAAKAWEKGVPIVALKAGASEQAQASTVSHTAALAGSDAGAQAFLDRLGIPRLQSLSELLETLKLLHCHGPLKSRNIASISCSGGEASLIADMAVGRELCFPALTEAQEAHLRDALGPMVALSNPLDYHTYIWRDRPTMARAWAGMTGEEIALTFSILDYPVTDARDWEAATGAALDVAATGAGFAVVSSLPELLPVDVAERLMAGGVVPMMGLAEALAAAEAAAGWESPDLVPVLPAKGGVEGRVLTEAEAKAALADHGVPVPRSCASVADAEALEGPFAVKGVGLAHKSEAGAVRLNVLYDALAQVAAEIGTERVLIEEMVPDVIVELLVGVTRDPAHGFVITLGAGGVLTEVLGDTASLLVPAHEAAIMEALNRLRISPLLHGYRGKPPVDLSVITKVVLAVQSYVLANGETLGEVEINPLLCTATGAVAGDALIRKA
ncbi:MAG: acetate--CoA ligase family protein [Silicimonas sp.]|nr:acetate--CoA ligase family protein [Silicimonas sp.]